LVVGRRQKDHQRLEIHSGQPNSKDRMYTSYVSELGSQNALHLSLEQNPWSE